MIDVPLNEDQSFHGVNYLLFSKRGYDINQHVVAEGVPYTGWASAINVFDPNGDSTWVSPYSCDYLPNVTVFYKKYAIFLTDYTIQARNGDLSENMPQSWKLEGSFDKKSWTKLHNITKTKDLDTTKKKKSYSCQSVGAFRYFRISMTEENLNGNNHFHIFRIEFFGKLIFIGERLTIYRKHYLCCSLFYCIFVCGKN